MSLSQPPAQSFDQALDTVCQRLRGSMTELLAEAKAPMESPTELSRHLKLNKTLAWRASKIVTAVHPRAVLEFLPAGGSIDLLLDACQKAGSSPHAIAQTRDALAALGEVVETHAGDKATFDLILASDTTGGGTAALMEGRRLAFMGNSATWGIQGQTRFAANFIAPAAGEAGERGMLDFATLGGLIGVRRLRADVSVPLFMRHNYNDDGSESRRAFGESIDVPGAGPLDLPLIREFCTDNNASLTACPLTGSAIRYDLLPGPIGNTAQTNWVFGWCDRATVSKFRDPVNRYGECSVKNFVPVETLICDLFLHRGWRLASLPVAMLTGQLGGEFHVPHWRERDRLPLPEAVESLGEFPPSPATPAIPRYTEMVRTVHARCGWDPADFVGYRIIIKHPPIPTTATLRWPLVDPATP
jgi:hypothetical protein